MSDDLQVEEPARRLSEPAGARDSDVWDRTWRPWDLYFAVVWVATLVITLGAPGSTEPVRIVASALFVLLVPWYVWVGRRELMAQGEDERRSVRYIVGLVLLFLLPAILVGETRLATFALAPQCFMLLRMRAALVAVAVINIVPVVGWAVLWRPDPGIVFFNALFAVVSLLFSAVFGSWIIRIIEQSQERAALIAELDASREEIARLSAERGALAERERMSREIHDTLAQGFTSLVMLVQAVDSELERDLPRARRHLDLMADTARQNLAEARALVAGGAPADLDGNSLPDALRRLAARHGSATTVEVTGTARPLSPALEVVALRTCQEALANATRHAGPEATVAISLTYAAAALSMAVRDTGCGFDDSVPPRGYGLSGLRARAAEVGGSAEVRSSPGEGTTIAVRLPLLPLLPLPDRSSA
ncbi:sensor histidine kinase [Streptomyces lunaelactis]|uniref:sensor histidine kinase n=1 Tax=Streptomyces lunaelactis TaxID=1535768 RepID=UPI001585960A|nr:sensor histidine kinase [Streptomyces lunaelactis]NUK10289.1 sensor histidine kinase [Streptomyces lunaelactis]NUK22953.1 sensor histidine kinase [Streptomyces lunaelactis]NUK52064.1 sensor histidine kinase [Streptomyces lunaelactis]NUK58875.1 sensor histidine kinase [Streptomyces lunaelactis]NUK65230.1 sensor histidine kinase [Streptomyces lunaelactis]